MNINQINSNKLLIIVSVILIILVTFSKTTYSEGSYFMPSSVGTSARMIRLGNIEGLTPLASTVFENPAALHLTKDFSLSLFTTKFMNEVDYKNIAASKKFGFGTIGLGYMNLGVEGIPHTFENNFGDPDLIDTEFGVKDYFNYSNSIGKLSYQLSQNKYLHFGLSLSYVHTSLFTYKGSGVNLDVGCLVTFENWDISIAGKNIVPSLKAKWNNGKQETIDRELVYATKYNFSNLGLDLLGQLKTVGKSRKYLFASAINFNPTFFDVFHLSLGYKDFYVLNNVKNNYTIGLGLDLFGVMFDYAYEQSNHFEFNHKHYFSLGIAY